MGTHLRVFVFLLLCGASAGCLSPPVASHQSSVDRAPECAPDRTTILAGQHIYSGSAVISTDADDLTIGLTGENGWNISEYHVYAGTGPVPTTRSGAVAPGRFPWGEELDEPVGSLNVTIPLAGLGVECGDSLNIAVHTVMVLLGDGGEVLDTQTGWAWGDEPFARHWGWSFDHEICCEPPGTCVYNKTEWRGCHLIDSWPLDEVLVGGVLYTKAELAEPTCPPPPWDGTGLLWIGTWGDGSLAVARQLVAALLNEANGAYVDDVTTQNMIDAEAWLVANADSDGMLPFGVFDGRPEFTEADELGLALGDYNNGTLETPACPYP
jgi:hypothetical protein